MSSNVALYQRIPTVWFRVRKYIYIIYEFYKHSNPSFFELEIHVYYFLYLNILSTIFKLKLLIYNAEKYPNQYFVLEIQ